MSPKKSVVRTLAGGGAAGLVASGLLWLVACAGDAARSPGEAAATTDPQEPHPGFQARPPDPEKRGLVLDTPGAAAGYVLFSPLVSDTTYLIDREGRAVHTWKSAYAPGSALYLLDDGHLLRCGRDPDLKNFRAGGTGGYFQELDWDGDVVWQWKLSSEERVQHHDIEPLPNGNILAIGWEVKSAEQAARAGRRRDLIPARGLWPDFVVEIRPIPPDDAEIVWEWHVWDHLVQHHDPEAPGYGDPAEHPGRLDINAFAKPEVDPEELEQLKALGYVPEDADPGELESDILHVNAVDYHAGLDQIALSVPELDEIWIIDHSTTAEEAAGSTGGRSGRGGELLYRWGNPRAYGHGGESAQRLFAQHDVQWIPAGLPGAGRLLVFSNGPGRSEGHWSTVLELAPPAGPGGRYPRPDGAPWGPAEPAWSYEEREGFYAPFISGAQRLENGNTMICSGPNGRLFEVDPSGQILWEYWNPYQGDIRLSDGALPQPGMDVYPYAVFRVAKLAPDHAALTGRQLRPLDPQPPIEATSPGAE